MLGMCRARVNAVDSSDDLQSYRSVSRGDCNPVRESGGDSGDWRIESRLESLGLYGRLSGVLLRLIGSGRNIRSDVQALALRAHRPRAVGFWNEHLSATWRVADPKLAQRMRFAIWTLQRKTLVAFDTPCDLKVAFAATKSNQRRFTGRSVLSRPKEPSEQHGKADQHDSR